MGGYSWGSDSSSSWSGGGSFDYGSAKAAYSSYDESKAYVSKASSAANQDMKSAYMVSSRVMNAALPLEDKVLLKQLTKEDLVVLPGQYDHVEKVLDSSGTPYTLVNSRFELDPKQIVLVNCPGDYLEHLRYKGHSGKPALTQFVEDGGYLVSTDWALSRVISSAFPGYIRRGGRETKDDLVEVDLVASGSPYTKGLGNGALKPIWWLESSSYPIKPLRNEGLEVLLGSQEMGEKYGESPIAVKFPWGDGRVVHVTSHFYLQTSKSKYDAQAQKTGLDFATKFLGMAQEDANEIKGIEDVTFGSLESAYTSIRFLHNIFLQKLKSRSNETPLIEDPETMKQIAGRKSMSLRKLPPGKMSIKLI